MLGAAHARIILGDMKALYRDLSAKGVHFAFPQVNPALV